jgi:hypothetical protein
LSLEGVVLKVAKVRPVIDPNVANEMPAMHVWDGRRLIKAWETLAALSTTIEDGAWPVNLKLETGLGLSLKWALPVPIGENDSPAQFTIFGAWATFERLIEHTP